VPRFYYRARDARGKLIRGIEFADSEAALDATLASSDLCLIDARVEQVRHRSRVKGQILIDFCYHLRSIVDGGIPLIQGLEDFCSDGSHPLHSVILDLTRKLRNGAQLSDAMADYPGVFPDLMRSLVRAGEETGRLDQILADLVSYLEWRDELGHQIRSAMAYPAVVVGGVLLLCIVMLTYVLPNFLGIFSELGVELPTATKVLLAISSFVRAHGLALLGGAIATGVGLSFALRTDAGRGLRDRLLLRFPLFGQLIIMLEMSRFAHNLSILYASGIPIVRALELIQSIVQNLSIRAALASAREEIKRGGSLSKALDRERWMPPLVMRMLSIGEQSGELDQSLGRVSAYYDRELPRVIKRTLAIFNTLSVVFLGGMIGTLALAIFVPVYKMLGSINTG